MTPTRTLLLSTAVALTACGEALPVADDAPGGAGPSYGYGYGDSDEDSDAATSTARADGLRQVGATGSLPEAVSVPTGGACHEQGPSKETPCADCGVGPASFADFQPASVVVGQPDALHGDAFGLQYVFRFPGSVLAHDGRLLVADGAASGVYVFDTVPSVQGALPDDVIGRDGLRGGTLPVGADALGTFVYGLSTDGERFAVADRGNARVLLYDEVPDGRVAASVVLGQDDFTSRAMGRSRSRVSGDLRGVHLAGDRLVVADFGNHRVLVWNTVPTESATLPDLVLGQADFDGGERNRGGAVGPDTLSGPTGVWTDGTRLAIADADNHRVLLWDEFPTEPGQPADRVVGQPDGTSSAPAVGATHLHAPYDVLFDGARLYVSDQFNHRVVSYDGWPAQDGPAATGVLGQSDLLHGAPDDADQDGVADAQPSAHTLNLPGMLTLDAGHLSVVDTANHRVMVFDGTGVR